MKGDTFQSFEPNALPLDAFEMDTSTAEKPVLKTKGGWKYDAKSLNTPDLTKCTDPNATNDSLIIYDASAGVNKRVVAGVLTAPPIGFVYWQLPGKSDPAKLYPGTTWSNISSSFAGDFFRAEGGYASAFGSGVQQPTRVIKDYWGDGGWHGAVPDCMSNAAANWDWAGRVYDDGNNAYPAGPNFGPAGHHVDGMTVRPQNRTIRLWERTA